MNFRRFILVATLPFLAMNAEAGEITFNTTTDTFEQSDDSISTFAVDGGVPQVTTENGVKVFTFDSIILSNDTVTVTGDAPLIVRSRTNFDVIDSVVNVVAGNAGGGTRGDRAGRLDPSLRSAGGSGGAGGEGARPDPLSPDNIDESIAPAEAGSGSVASSPANAGQDGGDGFGGTQGGAGGDGGTIATGQPIGGAGGAFGDGGTGGQGAPGLTGDDGGDGGTGEGGSNTATGRALTGGGGGGGGGAGADGSGGSGGGGGGGGDLRTFINSFGGTTVVPGGDGGAGGAGGAGKAGQRGGHGGAGGGAVAFEALGLLRVTDSALNSDGANGAGGISASNSRNAGEAGQVGSRLSRGGFNGNQGGTGGAGGAGGLGGDGGRGGGGAGGTVKLSGSIVDIKTDDGTNTVSANGGTGGENGALGRFIVESNTDAGLGNIGTLTARTETFTGNRAINPFIHGDVETPFMLLSQAASFDSEVDLAGLLSDVDVNDLRGQGLVPDFPISALGALTRLDGGFGGGDFIGFDVLLFSNLTEDAVTEAKLGVDPLSQGTGFLADLPIDLAGLSVFATLIPEDGTTFSATFGSFGIFNIELENGETQFITNSISAVPVPAALPLLGTAIAGLIFVRRRRRKD